MRVLLFGASGVIGRPLVRRLVAAGHSVTAATRSVERFDDLRALGAEPRVCDAEDPDGVRTAALEVRPDAIIHQLTALPRRIDPRKVSALLAPTNRLRAIATAHLVEAARAAGCRRFVAQSIAFAYRPQDEPGAAGASPPARAASASAPAPALRVEEDPLYLDAPPAFAPVHQAVQRLEELTTASPDIDGVVLRYGFFYGPGSVYGPGGSFVEDLARRRVPIIGRGTGVFSFIHVEDAASATVRALEAPPGIYNVVDDDPAPVATWIPALAERLGAPRPLRVPRWLGRLAGGPYADHMMVRLAGASNAKAKRALGWAPERPSWRDGLGALA